MNKLLQKFLSLAVAGAMTASLAVTAFASEALGEELTGRDTLLNEQTQLSTNVFWSTAYEDLRTENLITYTPNSDVRPIVTHGGALTDRSTVSNTAKALEAQGYRVVAGVNGDFFNFSTGLPIGITVSDGKLLSSDGGYYAIGFREDGTAILGKPQLKVSLDTGYTADDGMGGLTPIVRQVAGVNKSRVSEGGIFLYTYDFNAKRTNGTTEEGIDLICTVDSGELAIGGTLSLTVQESRRGSATPIQPDQIVLSVNLKSDPYYVDAMARIQAGDRLTVTVTAADPAWNEVDYAVGALHSLVENGVMMPGLEKDAAPRTAVGQRPDGTLLFYTIDGRRSGHSIGATMEQVAQRMIELGCVTALGLDGGGSTALTVTSPASTEAALVNRPSGAERTVTNQIFLVASNQPSGVLDHFFVQPDAAQVLAGSTVGYSASAVDTHYIPMNTSFDVRVSNGEALPDSKVKTPRTGGTVTITASGRGGQGSAEIQAIANPDDIALRFNDKIVTELTVVPGSVTRLVGSAAYQHRPLYADAQAFDWTFSGDCGTIDPTTGDFTATKPGSGVLTLSAGGKSTALKITVSRIPLKTAEDFEGDFLHTEGYGSGITLSPTTTGQPVRFGRKAMELGYDLAATSGYTAEWSLLDPLYVSGPYTALSFWIYGDNSGNTLDLLSMDASGQTVTALSLPLDFTGWRQVSIDNWNENMALQGFRVTAPVAAPVLPEGLDPELLDPSVLTPVTPTSGKLYLDQFVGAFPGATDLQVPVVTIQGLTMDAAPAPVEGAAPVPATGSLTAHVEDLTDGFLPRENVHVTLDGSVIPFHYDDKTGKVAVPLTIDGMAHRVTVTGLDGSGNIGRASYDIPAAEGTPARFTDTADYWGRTYVDYLYTAGITTGYSDGSFQPNSNISRAQFSVMLYRYLELDESKYADVVLPFADLDKIPEYALPAIRALYTEGVINGSTGADGLLYFNPAASLTRAQAATMIGRTQARGYAMTELAFTDAAAIPAYAREFISTMAAQGIINGYQDGSFQPHKSITRGQMAKILYNLM